MAGLLDRQVEQVHNALSNWWTRLNTDSTEPVNILGTSYEPDSPEMARAIASRIWFTYRTGFTPIHKHETGPAPVSFLGSMLLSPTTLMSLNSTAFTLDVGWGCMIRTSQSLLANALLAATGEANVALFYDNYDSRYSLHNFVRVASELPLEVKPGQWFGPSAASLSIKRLCALSGDLNVLVSESCNLVDLEVAALLDKPLLVLLPIRLGIERVNELYHGSIAQLLTLPQLVGIAGGKPSLSYYFFGVQGEKLLFLDPHNLQLVSHDRGSYRTAECRLLPMSQMDPSMVVGLVVKLYEDYVQMKASLASNKIVHFHASAPSSVRRPRSKASAEGFVDVGDESLEESEFSGYDIVERPPSVRALEET